jgi:hypothetical protein
VKICPIILVLCAGQLNAQVPIEIVTTDTTDSMSTRYSDALKREVLASPSFVLKTSGPRLRVTPVVGGTVTTHCGEHRNEFRGIAMLMSGSLGDREMVFASVFEVGEEREAASKNLLRLYEAATTLGVPGTR